MKRKKRIRQLSAFFGLLAIFVGLVLPAMVPNAPVAEAATDYKTVDIPSKLVTATSDAIVSAGGGGDKESSSGSGDTSNLMSAISTVVRAGNFGNYGLFYGQISSSKTDNYNALRGGSGVGRGDIKDLDTRTDGQLSQYLAFGRAVHQMLLDTSTSNDNRKKAVMASPTQTEAEMRQMVSAFTKHARELVGRVNPLPFFRAMGDSSILANPKYISPKTGNFWLILINSDPTIREFFNFIGGDAVRTMFGINTAGGWKISMATMIVFVVAVFTLILGVIGSFLGVGTASNTGWGQALRRIGVRLTIAVVGFQLFVVFGGELEKMFNGEDTVAKVESNVVIDTVKRNLNFEDWYAVGFALPPDVKIPIVDGKMLLTQETVLAINRFTAAKLKQGDYDTALTVPAEPETNSRNRLGNIGEQSMYKHRKRAADVRGTVGDDVAYAYVRLAEAANRLTFTPTFSAPATKNYNIVAAPGGASLSGGKAEGTKWDTSALDNAASEIGSGKKLEDQTVNQIRSSEYVTSVGLQMTAGDGGYTLSMPNNASYGISPIAAYNLMNSSFDASGITVNNNLQKRTVNTVIHNAQSTGIAKPSDNKSAVNTIVLIVLVYTAIISLFKIVGSAVGGVLRGTSAAFGSAVGFGTLIGAAITLFIGTMVLALAIDITMNLMDELWAIIDTMFRDMTLDALNDVVDEIFKGIDKIPLLGPVITWAVKGTAGFATGLVITILMLATMPRVLAVGIKVIANYFAGLPDEFGERARMMQEHFTGTRSYRGRDLGVAEELGAAIKSGQAGARTLGKGVTAIAGAGAAWAGSKILDEAAKREAAERADFDAANAEDMDEKAIDPNRDPDDTPPTDDAQTPETTETTESTESTTAENATDDSDAVANVGDDATAPETAEEVADGELPVDGDDYDFDDEVAASIAQEQETSSDRAILGPDGKPLSGDKTDTPSDEVSHATGDGPTPPTDVDGAVDAPEDAKAPEHGEYTPDVATGEAPKESTQVEQSATKEDTPKAPTSGETTPDGRASTVSETGDATNPASTGSNTQPTGTPESPTITDGTPDKPAQPRETGDTNNAQETTNGKQVDGQNRPNIPMQTNNSDKPVVHESQPESKPEFKPSMGTRILANLGHGLRGVSGGRDEGQVAAGAAQVVASIAGGGTGGKLVDETLMRRVEQRRNERARTGAGDVDVENRRRKTATVTEEQAVRAGQRVSIERQATEVTPNTDTAKNWWDREVGTSKPKAKRDAEVKKREQREQREDLRNQRNSEFERSTGDGFEQEYSAFDDYNDDVE